MVSVIFKTVYLFLVLFTLPQVLAAPGPAIVDLHSRDDPDIITLHNRFRQDADLPPLTWNAALAGVARLQVTTCIKNEIPHIIELVSTEDTPLLAFKYWVSQEGKTQDQIFSRTVRQVGCASASVRCKGSFLHVCVYDSK